jgi:hypothetical protein
MPGTHFCRAGEGRQSAAKFRSDPLLCRILQNDFATFRFDFKDFLLQQPPSAVAIASLIRSVPEHLPVSEELILIQSAKAGPINDLAGGHLDPPCAQR